MRIFAFAVLGLAAAFAGATELPGVVVTVDGPRVDVGVPTVELTTYRVDLAKILPALTDGHAVLRQTGVGECRILVDGQPRLRLPIGENVVPAATSLAGGPKIALTEAPLQETGKDGKRRTMIDVRALGQITGASANIEGKSLAFITPESWARRIGIADDRLKGLNARSIGAAPDFGVTPPAKTMVAWARPRGKAFVQIYKGLADTTPAPMLATSANGRVAFETPSDVPTMWPASASEPALVPTYHLEKPDGGVAMYATVVSPTDLGEDPVHAINAGEAGDGWTVVGTRQRVLDIPMSFRLVAVEPGESMAKFAARTKMPVGLVLAMNGYGEGAPPPAKTRLLVIDKVQPLAARKDQPHAVGLYEVRPNDTIDGLAERWGVDAGSVCLLNELDEGQDLFPGQVISQVVPGDKPPVEKPKITKVEATGKIKSPVGLRPTSSSPPSRVLLPPGSPVSICGKVEGGLLYVQCGEVSGYVPAAAVSMGEEPPIGPPNPRARAIVTEALAHLGTPYNWGGNDITRGIDCSHFVAAVLTRSGLRAPSPPVSSQEAQGAIVHWKPGLALRGLRTITFPNSQYPGQPSLDRLQIGDRIIIQRSPVSQRVGGRHTGVFIGPYRGRFGNFKYAVVHAGSRGVAVVSFNAMWKDYRYTVHDNFGGRVAQASPLPSRGEGPGVRGRTLQASARRDGPSPLLLSPRGERGSSARTRRRA